MESPLKDIVKRYPVKLTSLSSVKGSDNSTADGGDFPAINGLTYAEPKIM